MKMVFDLTLVRTNFLNFCILAFVENHSLKYITMMFIINAVALHYVYTINIASSTFRDNLDDANIYQAFSQPIFIYIGIVANISSSAPTVVEIFLDLIGERISATSSKHNGKYHDPLLERILFVSLNVVTSSCILSQRDNKNIPYIYACLHNLQFVGNMGIVLATCNKLVPKYFSFRNVLFAQAIFSIATVTTMVGFGQSLVYWPNILNLLLFAVFLYAFLCKSLIPWLFNLYERVIMGEEVLSINELFCLWYSLTTVLILIFIHITLGYTKLFDYSQFTQSELYIIVYTFALFTIIISSVPARLAAAAADRERQSMIDLKGSLIRYMSHEVRSPLNIIYSGLKFMMSDMKKLPPSEEKDSLGDTLAYIQQASDDLLTTMDDIVQLENMDAGTFFVDPKMTPCSDLNDIASQCGLVAAEKGVIFNIKNEFDHPPPITPLSTMNAMRSSAEIDVSLLERGQEESTVSEDLFLYVDAQKLRQVLRNLISNAVKFTSPGFPVTVNIRAAKLEELSSATESGQWTPDAAPESALISLGYAFCSYVMVEVVDSGVGIAKESLSSIFNKGTQFSAQELQVKKQNFVIICYIYLKNFFFVRVEEGRP